MDESSQTFAANSTAEGTFGESTLAEDLADWAHFLVEGPVLGSVCVLGAAANALSTLVLLPAAASSSFGQGSGGVSSAPGGGGAGGGGSARDQVKKLAPTPLPPKCLKT